MNASYKGAVVPRTAVGAAEWDALVETSPAGGPFALSAWQDMITGIEEWGLEDHSAAIVEDGQLRALLPLQYSSHSRTLASSGWGGSGPVWADGVSERARQNLVTKLVEHVDALAVGLGAERFEFWVSPVSSLALDAIWGVNPYVFFGFEDRSGLSQVIDLATEESDLWRGLSESARQAVNKARAAGITVEPVDWNDHLDDYYDHHCRTYSRTGVSPHPRAYFAGIAAIFGRRGLSTLWHARSADGTSLGYHNSLSFRHGAWYHTGCSSELALANGANYLLFWSAMLGARASGRRWYDCGEVHPVPIAGKIAGLSTFKRKFGGVPHRYFKCVRPYTGHVSASDAIPHSSRIRRLFNALSAVIPKATRR